MQSAVETTPLTSNVSLNSRIKANLKQLSKVLRARIKSIGEEKPSKEGAATPHACTPNSETSETNQASVEKFEAEANLMFSLLDF